MGLTKIKLLLLSLLFTSASYSQNIKGFYVDGFDGILGNTSSENTLLDYVQANGYNYLCLYNVAGLNLLSATVKTQFASFISRAKGQYGITQVGVSAELSSFFSTYIIPYNAGRSASEKVDVLNFEFEFWVTNSITNLYCTKYLTPGGYSCDTAGACAFAKTQFTSIDNLAASNGLISEMYFGWPNQGQMLWFASRADRLLLHAYRTSDVDVYSYSRTRLSYLSTNSTAVKIIPIFSSESSFMGPWLASHPISQPYTTYAAGLAAETASWKSKITLYGYHWFKYTTMPVNTTVTATITAGGPTTFCTGGSVTLTANSGTGQTYQWVKNGTNISGATSISKSMTASGSYTVKVTKNGTTATSAAVVVTVNSSIPTPTITANGPLSFCPGGSVILSSSSSTGNLWSNGATTQSITVTTSVSRSVTVTSGTCSATSATTTVTVTSSPSAPTITASGSVSICPGTSITLASSATTVGGYVWSNGATTRSIAVAAAGTYWVRTGTSTCYSQSTNKVTTLLTAPPTPTISAGGSTNIGSSGSVTLTSSSNSVTSYLWTTGSTSNAINVSTAGTYNVTVTGSNGCKATSAPKTVTSSTCTPPSAPTISTSNSTNVLLNGQTMTLTSSYTTGGWLWSNGATTRSINVTTGGTFTVRSYSGGNCYSTSLPITIYLIYSTRMAGTEEAAPGNISLTTFPNPSNGQFHVSFNCEKEQSCMISLYDLSGRMVLEKNLVAAQGNNVVEVNAAPLNQGTYLMRLSSDDFNEQLRLNIYE
jgi:hypothetical protein